MSRLEPYQQREASGVGLSEQDQELLELTALKVPWHMVCGDLHHQFDSVQAMAERLTELRDAGFITILPSGEDAEEVSTSGLVERERYRSKPFVLPTVDNQAGAGNPAGSW